MAWTAPALAATAPPDARATLDSESLAIGLRILADLLEAGLPLSRALVAFEELAPAGWSAGVPRLRASVREGTSLARSLEEMSLGLPPVVVGLVRAGEAGGGIAPAIRRAADHAEADATNRATIRAALAYPVVVGVAGFGSVGVMVGLVLPRFAGILDGLGQSMPPMTRAVLDVSAGLRAGAFPAAIALVMATSALMRWRASPSGRLATDAWMLRLPLIGTVRRSAATARLCAALSALLESGVPLRAALRQAAPALGDAAIASRLEKARERIVAGERPSRALHDVGAMTPTACRLIASGEETGHMGRMLAFAARIEQGRADRIMRTAIRLIEPALILAFAAIVGVVAAAMLQAVYAVRPG